MFEGCTTLTQLSNRRRELIQGGTPVQEVNAAYNRAKRALVNAKPEFRRPPTFSGEPTTQKSYMPYKLFNTDVPKNVLRITDEGIYL